MPKEIEDLDLEIPEDDEDIDTLLEEADDVDKLKKALSTAIAQKEHWRTKATAKAEEKPEKPVVVEKKETDESLREEITRIRLEAKGYDEDESDLILKAAKGLGIDPTKAAQEDFIIAKIEKMREAKKLQDAIPDPSGKAAGKGKKTAEWYIEHDEMPEDPEMFYKVTELLKSKRK